MKTLLLLLLSSIYISTNTNGQGITISSGAYVNQSSGDLNLTGNWVNNGSFDPNAGTVIMAGTTQSISGTATVNTFNNLIIEAGSATTITANTNVTVTTLTNNQGNSGLILQSNASGTGSLINNTVGVGATVERYMVKNTWHNISTSVTGQDIPSFLVNATNTIPISGPNYGMMYYSESGGKWTYITTSTTGNLVAGNGYLLRHTTDASVSTSGTLNQSGTNVNLTQIGNGWNSVGNPFPCSIGVREDATTAENFLTYNAAAFDPSYAVLYVWDEPAVRVTGVSYYKVIGNAGFSSSKPTLNQAYLQPGQGFLMKSKTGGSTISFTETMKIHENTASYFKAPKAPWAGININVNSSTKSASTAITFHENMTTGLDITYDAGLLGGDPALKLYSRLVEDNGVNFTLQCLPDQNFDTLIVPLGLDFTAGGKVTFTSEALDLPSAYKIIFEDRLLGVSTDFKEASSSYTVTINPNSNGTGRFFLHAIIDNIAPSIPINLTSSDVTANSFTLSWSASDDNVGVTGYEIFNGEISLGTTSNLSMSISELTSASLNTMSVKAVDAANNWSGSSVTLEVTTLDNIAPGNPVGLTSSAITGNSFILSWNASDDNVGVSGYEVFNGETSVGNTSDLSIKITGLTSAELYAMTVVAFDAAHNNSLTSDVLEVVTLDTIAPSIPSSLSSTEITENAFILSWVAAEDNVEVTSYEILIDGIYFGKTTELSINITGLSCETSYEMTVKASDAVDNWSIASNVLAVSALPCPEDVTDINTNSVNSISVYPNPVTTDLILKNIPDNASITAYNMVGKRVSIINSNGNTVKIDVSKWEKGLYLFQIQFSSGVIIKRVIVK